MNLLSMYLERSWLCVCLLMYSSDLVYYRHTVSRLIETTAKLQGLDFWGRVHWRSVISNRGELAKQRRRNLLQSNALACCTFLWSQLHLKAEFMENLGFIETPIEHILVHLINRSHTFPPATTVPFMLLCTHCAVYSFTQGGFNLFLVIGLLTVQSTYW